MKKILLCSIGAALLLSSCVRSSLAPVNAPVTVISEIICYDLPLGGATAYPAQRTVTDFTYNGKLLSTVTETHTWGDTHQGTIITDFTYTLAGLLKSTTVANYNGYPRQSTDIVSSAVTYSGDYMSSISFYQQNQAVKTFTLTYQNGLLKQICDLNSVKITYSYDNQGNNTSELDEVYQNGQPTGQQSAITNSAFDTKINFSSLLPMWVYFKCYGIAQSFNSLSGTTTVPLLGTTFDIFTQDESLTFSPGKNNPVKSCNQGPFPFKFSDYYSAQDSIPTTQVPYSYQYNANGYPTVITYPHLFNNTYTYTTVQ